MGTKLIGIRLAEQNEQGEIVFLRRDEAGRDHTIYGQVCYESWQQWGADKDVLGDNVDTIEVWRSGGLDMIGLSPKEDTE